MVDESKKLNGRHTEVEQQLERFRQESRYYQKIARDSGRYRLRDIDQLSRLINQLKETEKALRRSEATFRALTESTHTGITIIQDERVVFMNPAVEMMLGYSFNEISSKSFLEFIHPEMRDFFNARLIARLNQENLEPCDEVKVIAKDDNIKWLNYTAVLFEYQGEKAILVSLIDITHKKLTEKSLQESEERYRNVVENLNVGMLVAQDQKLVFVNKAVSNFLGYSHDEILANPNPFEYIFQDDRELVLERHLQRINNENPPETYPFRVVTKDGEIKWVEATGTLTNWNGRPATLNFFLDIADRIRFEKEKKELEKQLLQAQKLEAVGTLASGISHNFRNILTVILMNCHILQKKHKNDSKLMANIGSMISYVERGSELVDQLLGFSRQEPKKEFQFLNLSEILREISELITSTFSKTIEIRSRVPESIPINGDYSALSQVFMNLCTNARDAMPSGGLLQIEAGIEADQARVVIFDTGEGMSKKTMEKCFEPFFTTKPVNQGTGLGLSTAYGIVKNHGGEIKVSSMPGKGSTFELHFPLAYSDKEIAPVVSKVIKSGQDKKVLVVEDELEICKLIEQLLRQSGYIVKYIDSGKKFITEYKSWRPDVVLLDRNMPEVDGISCAEDVLAYDPHAKIIIISGYDENGTSGITENQKKIIKGYITKPINIDDLNTQLSNVLHPD